MNYCSKYLLIKSTFQVVHQVLLIGRQEVLADVVVVRLPRSILRHKLPVLSLDQDFARLNKVLLLKDLR